MLSDVIVLGLARNHSSGGKPAHAAARCGADSATMIAGDGPPKTDVAVAATTADQLMGVGWAVG